MAVFILKYDGCHNQTYSSTCICFICIYHVNKFPGHVVKWSTWLKPRRRNPKMSS